MLDALAAIEAMDNGAHFLRCDVHIHTYGCSKDVKDTLLTPKRIVESAVARRISVISITDHNSVANVQAALDAALPYANQLLVLPGVEVSTDDGHLLCYFPDIDRASRFVGLLDIVEQTATSDGRTRSGMANVAQLARSLLGVTIAAHIDRSPNG